MSIGIVGGLGPETTADFYLRLIEKSRQSKAYPHIVIESIPLLFSVEKEMILGKQRDTLLPFLITAIKRLQYTACIAVPCNTAHMFIRQLRNESAIPVMSITEEVCAYLKKTGCKKAGLLGTSHTINSGIYSDRKIKFIAPGKADQETLSQIILSIVQNKVTSNEKKEAQRIAERLSKKCDRVVLACTDLQQILKGDFVDSFDILVEAAFDKLRGDCK